MVGSAPWEADDVRLRVAVTAVWLQASHRPALGSGAPPGVLGSLPLPCPWPHLPPASVRPNGLTTPMRSSSPPPMPSPNQLLSHFMEENTDVPRITQQSGTGVGELFGPFTRGTSGASGMCLKGTQLLDGW